jgi:rubrerythrin
MDDFEDPRVRWLRRRRPDNNINVTNSQVGVINTGEPSPSPLWHCPACGTENSEDRDPWRCAACFHLHPSLCD